MFLLEDDRKGEDMEVERRREEEQKSTGRSLKERITAGD